ncbi:MAG: 2Fe-2S iron-sulfur cluster binding domain-containing protein, partial [Microcystis sp.]
MTTTHKVEISHLGKIQTIEVREDQTILQAAYDAG